MLGIDTSAAKPRAVTAQDLAAADVVVTMKPGLGLPAPVAGHLIEWDFPDPGNWQLEGVRTLRDAIREQLRAAFEGEQTIDSHQTRAAKPGR